MCDNDPKKSAITPEHSKCVIVAVSVAVSVAVAVLVLSLVVVCTAFAVEISMLKSDQATSMQQIISTISERLDSVALQVNGSADRLFQQQVGDYSTLDTRIEQLDSRIEQLTTALSSNSLFSQYQNFPAPSCAALPSIFPSGYYWVRASNGSAVRVYCDMTRSCGGVTGGWTRVFELDMTNSSHQCPSDLRERNYSSQRLCIGPFSRVCSPVMISTSNISYTSVCGRVIAYQVGTPDAFNYTVALHFAYVDGVSLTHGDQEKHIWTFAATLNEVTYKESNCPCIQSDLVDRATVKIPSFVGDDYFCDTGSHQDVGSHCIFYSDDPLWDGAGCGGNSTCCQFNNPPWFYKELPQSTTDDINMRLCRSSHSFCEADIAIEAADIYVR